MHQSNLACENKIATSDSSAAYSTILWLSWNWIFDLVTGYLTSAMLTLFIFYVPPLMMIFSAIEGPVARSLRKKSDCISLKECGFAILGLLPDKKSADFFMTYILTSGWISLALELMQPISLLLHWLDKCLFRGKHVLSCESQTFPYHTELPRVLLFGLLGFTSSITAPLLLPFLLVYFFFAHLVYRNQFMNVYVTKYDTAIIVSLMLMQVILLGVFGLKKLAVASSFTIPLIICTFLFHLYYRQRFLPVFKRTVARGGVYTLPSHLSPGVRDLIPRLLVVEPKKRMTIHEIRTHPWFQAHLPRYLAVPPPDTLQ